MTHDVEPGRGLTRAQRVDAATPASRNRVIDFLRAAAITVVVLGHWTLVAVTADGTISTHGVLARRWTHPLTWVFQVMPVFFLVGGYANALSWRSARRRGESYGGWLRARLRRLCLPLVPPLVLWLVLCIVLFAVGVPPASLRTASQSALGPTWFLAAYLMVVVVAPPCLWLWERIGWWSVVGGLILAGGVDLLSIGTGRPLLGYPNYLFVWATFHQVGYAWLDGRLRTVRQRMCLLAVGAFGLAVTVGLGPYPVSMISSGVDAVSNSSPTRVTMAFLGMVQAALVLFAEPALARWLRRPRVWLVTVMINRRIMTWFLWHRSAMIALAFGLLALGGVGLHREPLSASWWLTRPVWWAVLIMITAVFVLIFGRFEDPVPEVRPSPQGWRPVCAAVAVIAALAVLAGSGLVTPDGVRWPWPLLAVLGLVMFGVLGRADVRVVSPPRRD